MLRTNKIALEKRLGTRIEDDAIVMEWLAEWAAAMHRRYNLVADG